MWKSVFFFLSENKSEVISIDTNSTLAWEWWEKNHKIWNEKQKRSEMVERIDHSKQRVINAGQNNPPSPIFVFMVQTYVNVWTEFYRSFARRSRGRLLLAAWRGLQGTSGRRRAVHRRDRLAPGPRALRLCRHPRRPRVPRRLAERARDWSAACCRRSCRKSRRAPDARVGSRRGVGRRAWWRNERSVQSVGNLEMFVKFQTFNDLSRLCCGLLNRSISLERTFGSRSFIPPTCNFRCRRFVKFCS